METRTPRGAGEVVVYRVDTEGMLQSVSEGIRALGHDPESLVGRPVLDLVHPGDRARVRHLLRERREGVRSVRGVTVRLLPVDDLESPASPRLYRFTVTGLYDRDRTFVGSRGVGHAVPMTVAADIPQATGLEDTPLGVLILDRSGIVLDGNLVGSDLLGTGPDELHGKSFPTFLGRASQSAFQDLFVRCLEGERAWIDVDLVHGDQEPRPARLHLQATEWLQRDRQVTVTLVDPAAPAPSGPRTTVEEVFQLTHDCVFFLEDDIIKDCNETAYHMFHADDPDMLLGLPLMDLSEDDDPVRRRLLKQRLAAAREGIPQRFHWSFRRISGEPVATNVTMTSLGEPDGRRLLVILQDTESLDYRLHLQRYLLDMASAFIRDSELPSSGALTSHLRQLASIFNLDRALLLRPARDHAGLVVDVAWPEDLADAGDRCDLPLGDSELDRFRAVDCFVVHDLDDLTDTETVEQLSRLGMDAILAIPFSEQGRLLGAFVLGQSRPRHWPRVDVESATLIASVFQSLWARRFAAP